MDKYRMFIWQACFPFETATQRLNTALHIPGSKFDTGQALVSVKVFNFALCYAKLGQFYQSKWLV